MRNTLSILLSARVKAEVFRILFGADRCELRIRELARRANLSDATIRQELKRLTSPDIVHIRRDGSRQRGALALHEPAPRRWLQRGEANSHPCPSSVDHSIRSECELWNSTHGGAVNLRLDFHSNHGHPQSAVSVIGVEV